MKGPEAPKPPGVNGVLSAASRTKGSRYEYASPRVRSGLSEDPQSEVEMTVQPFSQAVNLRACLPQRPVRTSR
jgi:hypothetical protein